jgi:hypothetical protein
LRFEDGTSVDQKNIAMKRSTLLLPLVMALGLRGECYAFSNRAALAATSREGLNVYPMYANVSDAQIIALEEKNHSDQKKLSRPGPTNEIEAKRLRLIFLLMMSPGQYRTPVH